MALAYDTYPGPWDGGFRCGTNAQALRSLGAGGDFSTYIQNPEFAAAWNTVQTQLSAEGNNTGSLAVLTAQNAFAATFDNLSSQLGVDPSTALAATKQFIVAGHTIAGAVNTVQRIIQSMNGGDPSQAFNLITGAMVGAAVTSGVVTAGVGALITIGVGLGLTAMASLGLFGAAPSGVSLPGCGTGTTWNPAPTIAVGCVGMQGATGPSGGANEYGSPFWRRFPKKTGGNANDSQWYDAVIGGFGVPQGSKLIQWAGSANGPVYSWSGWANPRLIDTAFSEWHYIACSSVPAGLEAFAAAFTQAWIANKEYDLNGLKSQPDWQVLRTLLGVWNRAHDGGTYVDLGPAAKGSLGTPSVVNGALSWSCPANLPPYFQTLISDLVAQGSSSDPIFQTFYNASANTIRIHTGSILQPANLATLLKDLGSDSGAAGASAPLSTPAKVAVGTASVATAAAVGVGILAWMKGQTFSWALNKVWDETSGAVRGAFKGKRRRR